jgi:hypothetical protein
MAASIAHLPEKPRERDHNKQQFAVRSTVAVWGRNRSGSPHRESAVGGCGEFEVQCSIAVGRLNMLVGLQ